MRWVVCGDLGIRPQGGSIQNSGNGIQGGLGQREGAGHGAEQSHPPQPVHDFSITG